MNYRGMGMKRKKANLQRKKNAVIMEYEKGLHSKIKIAKQFMVCH
jgi:hypothetical protein